MASVPVYCPWMAIAIFSILSTAHAAFIYDGKGFRQVDMSKLYAAAKVRQGREQTTRDVRPQWCSRGDSLVLEGSTWQERCRQCRCTESGTQCTGRTCAGLAYNPIQETTCAKWADDCCCAQEGCMTEDGIVIPINGDMPVNPRRPCDLCTCKGGNRTECAIQSCWPYQCVDMQLRQGQCCPVCPNGRNCGLPFQVRRQLSQIELLATEPVREFSPVTLFAGTPNEVTCTCNGNMVAVCTGPSERRTTMRVPNMVG